MKYSVAVAGAHGKTTTTSMVGEILRARRPRSDGDRRRAAEGRSARTRGWGRGRSWSPKRTRATAPSSASRPRSRSITNIDAEHLDYYKTLERVQEAFATFVNRVPFYGTIVACRSTTPTRASIRAARRSGAHVTYGFAREADFGAATSTSGPTGASFDAPCAASRSGRSSCACRASTTRSTRSPPSRSGWELGRADRRHPGRAARVPGRRPALRAAGRARGVRWSTTTAITRPRSRPRSRRFAPRYDRADRRRVPAAPLHADASARRAVRDLLPGRRGARAPARSTRPAKRRSRA